MPEKTDNRICPGPVSRREWLRIGGLSLGALATGLPPSLSQLLAAGEQARSTSDFSVILFWANGGPSHLDLFDLKPHEPTEFRGPFRPIATTVPGMQITEELPRLAAMAEHFTLIRSLHHERAEHSGGTHRFITGYSSRAANLQDSEYPEIGSIVAQQFEDRTRDVPLFVANTKLYGSGPAYLGQAHAPYMPAPEPHTSTGNNTYDPVPIYSSGGPHDTLAVTEDAALALRRRAGLLQEIDSLSRRIDASSDIPPIASFQKQALAMLSSSRTRDAFDLSQESDAIRRRYGETHWGRSLLTCRRLVQAGVRFVQCQATYRLKPETGRTSNWDDHSVNSDIFKAYREKLPSFDQSVTALISDLKEQGLDERVLFIFCGEFGRTPTIRYQDASGRPGRDHWPRAMSVLLAGGGLKMGQVIGATNPRGEEPAQRAMDSNCLLATLYKQFGINPHHLLHDRTGRPLPILPHGEPIAELV